MSTTKNMQSIETKGEERHTEKVVHLHGFDYLRVFFMIMVLMGHCNLFQKLAEKIGSSANIFDVAYYGIQSSAVPAFMLMSSFLFLRKPVNKARSFDRIYKLVCLHAFWMIAWVTYAKSTPKSVDMSWIEYVLRGGSLHLYTFSVLIILTPLCHLASKLGTKSLCACVGISTMVVWCFFTWVTSDYKWLEHSYYWQPTCYVMMPFVAMILARNSSKFRNSRRLCWQWIIALVVIGSLFSILEWPHAPSELADSMGRRWLPKAGRVSVQLFAGAMVLLSFVVRKPGGKLIAFLASNSLGVYCIHGFVLRYAFKLGDAIAMHDSTVMSSIIAFLSLLIFCPIASTILRKILHERLV